MRGAGLVALSVAFPEEIRTNDYFRNRVPEAVAASEEKTLARLWARHLESPPSAFDAAFERYAGDPFRGTRERRALGPGESMLPIEIHAARSALEAGGLEPTEIDVVLACSFLPDQPGIGSAVFIAGELGIEGPGWNIESACSSATAGLQLATSLVKSGQASRVLVVISCSYSRAVAPEDSLGWFLGDGCAAFVVGPAAVDQGVIASKLIHTAETCGAFEYALAVDDDRPWIRIDAHGSAGRLLRQTAGPYLRRSVRGVLDASGVELDDIAFFAFNTPTAWYADFCVRELGIEAERTIDTYPLYANMGPVLWPVNLHHAACRGKPAAGDLVLVYSVGSVSSAGAVLLRWGDVGLGPLPGR